jgi:glycine cleavage system H protein
MINLKEDKRNGFRVIPEGDKRCVWMELGVVSYKICDRDFDCDHCPLNEGLAGTDNNHHKERLRILKESHRFQIPVFSRLARYKVEEYRYFHPNHIWILADTLYRVTIGIDGILAAVLGSINKVSFPTLGKTVKRGENCCKFHQKKKTFSIKSPVSGQIVGINEVLIGYPDKVILDSMGGGWLMAIKPSDLEEDLKYCRHGDAVFPWYLKELEWFDSVLSKSYQQNQEVVGTTMYDGGELSRHLGDLLTPEQYRLVVVSLMGTG